MFFNLICYRATINLFLVIDLIGCCCVYIVFVGENIEPVIEKYAGNDWDLRVYMAMLLPPLLIFSFVKNLKYLAPFSMVANILIAVGIGITFYYIFRDTSEFKSVPAMSEFGRLPLFFGTAIFALEGVGVVSIFNLIFYQYLLKMNFTVILFILFHNR